jgi:hypothetical protein
LFSWNRKCRIGALAALLLIFGACTHRQPTGVFLDPAFGTLIPPDTKLMAGVRLDKIRETPLYKKLDGQFDLNRRLNLFSERTGLNPRKDTWQLLLVSNGTRTLVMARGNFSVADGEPSFKELGGEHLRYKDYSVIGTPETSVFFLNPSVGIAGRRADLENFIDHRAEYFKVPSDLQSRLKELPYPDQLWVVSNGTIPDRVLAGPDTTGAKSLLSNLVGYVQGAQLGLHVNEGVDFNGSIDCTSAEGAQRVRDAIKGVVGLARLRTPDNQIEMLKVYDTIRVNQNAWKVTLSASIAPDMVDPLLKILLRLRSR